MGDRGTIKIIGSGPHPIYLYTHWGGSDLDSVLRTALARRQRWDDPPYLTRIIFCELVKGDEAGYGIGTEVTDSEHDILCIDMNRDLVYRVGFDHLTGMEAARTAGPWTYGAYLAMTGPTEREEDES